MQSETTFDLWQPYYDAHVIACDEAGEYPFAGYRALQDQIFEIVHAREGASVLDLGCGTGRMAARLSRAGHPVTGLDFSRAMLSEAAVNAPDARFVPGRLAMPLPEELAGETYDCILAAYSIHHLTDEEKWALLRALRAHLAPEGVIVLGDVSFPTRAGLENCREAYGDKWDDEEYYLVRDELEAALPEYDVDCIPISFCADVYILSPAE
ncbi:MAG: class I SAM-dependent methyltransferase [Clostridia bacterium]|nr:class I SAM-dependent methyltransferase [Clostridia bacterium]